MPTSQEKLEDARKKIDEGNFIEASLDELELILRQYVHENEKSIGMEKTIFDITKANFAVFGAIMLVSSSSFFANLQSPEWSLILAGLAIGFVSLAASVVVTFYHKYLRVHEQKTSILQKGFWRRRPLYWIELKYTVEELITKFENSSNLRNWEYISYRYVMKWVNLLSSLWGWFSLCTPMKSGKSLGCFGAIGLSARENAEPLFLRCEDKSLRSARQRLPMSAVL